jgi:hypothetical protein
MTMKKAQRSQRKLSIFLGEVFALIMGHVLSLRSDVSSSFIHRPSQFGTLGGHGAAALLPAI